MIEINTTIVVMFGAFLLLLVAILGALLMLIMRKAQQDPFAMGEAARLQAAATKLRLPVLKECGNCEHWDWQAGQDAMRQHPAFAQASGQLSPHMMARGVDHDDAGGVMPPRTEVDANWGELGACHETEEGVFMHMNECPVKKFKRATNDQLLHRQRRQDDAARLIGVS